MSDPSDDAGRRLWFDYLVKINDRDLQAAQASGMTTWVMLGVLAAVAFKLLPQVPPLMAMQGGIRRTLILALFEFDALAFLGLSLGLGLISTASRDVARFLPVAERRSTFLFYVGLELVVAIMLTGHVWAARASELLLIRCGLVAFGLLWLLNIICLPLLMFKRFRKSRRYQIPDALIDVGGISGRFAVKGAKAYLPLGLAACFFLFVHFRSMLSFDWVLPLSVATELLLCCVVVVLLAFRALQSQTRKVYQRLERDLVLEQLSPAQIRERFIHEALGPSVSSWLKDLADRIASQEKDLRALADKAEAELLKYSEQNGSQTEPSQTLRSFTQADLEKARNHLNALNTQISQMLVLHSSEWESAVLSDTFQQWKVRLADLQLQLERAQTVAKRVQQLEQGTKAKVTAGNA